MFIKLFKKLLGHPILFKKLYAVNQSSFISEEKKYFKKKCDNVNNETLFFLINLIYIAKYRNLNINAFIYSLFYLHYTPDEWSLN